MFHFYPCFCDEFIPSAEQPSFFTSLLQSDWTFYYHRNYSGHKIFPVHSKAIQSENDIAVLLILAVTTDNLSCHFLTGEERGSDFQRCKTEGSFSAPRADLKSVVLKSTVSPLRKLKS
jgi:hypothetical protein